LREFRIFKNNYRYEIFTVTGRHRYHWSRLKKKNRLLDVCFNIFIQRFVILMDLLLVFVNLAQSLKLSTIVKMMVCRRKELLNALKYVSMETEYIWYILIITNLQFKSMNKIIFHSTSTQSIKLQQRYQTETMVWQ